MKKRRYPELPVDEIVASANQITEQPHLTIGIDLGYEKITKSVVKTALALACNSGIRREDCQYAIDHLNETCTSKYADIIRPFTSDWPTRIPKGKWHHISVVGITGSL